MSEGLWQALFFLLLSPTFVFAEFNCQTPITNLTLFRTDDHRGCRNLGLFKIENSDGEALLKVLSDDMKLSEYQFMIEIQNRLAKKAWAPKIFKVFQVEELKEALKLNRVGEAILPDILKDSFGILMEEIKGGWNFSKSSRFPPEMRRLSLENIKAQIREIEAFLSNEGIRASDIQLMIDPQGKVYLIDFDQYSFTAPRPHLNYLAFEARIRELESLWN